MGILDYFLNPQKERCSHPDMYLLHRDLGAEVVEFCAYEGCGYKKFIAGKEAKEWKKRLKRINRKGWDESTSPQASPEESQKAGAKDK